MNVIVVEREFEEPVDIDGLQEIENNGAWCLANYRVTHLYTYVAHDLRRTLCIYRAPDAEAVRDVQRTLDMPYTRIWSARTFPEGVEMPPPLPERAGGS